MTVFYTTLDCCLLFGLSVRPSSMRSSVQRTSLEARIRTIDIVTEDGMGNQAFALESVRLHGCAQLPGSFSNVLLSAPEVPPCALDSVVFIRDGWLQARSDGLPVVCCNALSVMRSAARSCVDVGSHTCHSSKTMSKSHPKQSILCEQGVVGQTADKVVSISGCVSRISLVLDAATDRPVFVVRVVDERTLESAIAFIGRKMLAWRRVLTPGQCYTFCNMLPPAPLRVSEPGHVIGPVHTYVVDESCLSFNCEDLDDITTSVPVLTQYPRPAADVSVVSEHLRVYKPQASLCHDVNPITSNGSDCVGVYFPVGSVVSLEGELTAVGTDWFELNGDERCTVWCVSGCQRDELLPFPLWLGCRVLCHDVHVLSVHTELGTLWLGFAACASTYVRYHCWFECCVLPWLGFEGFSGWLQVRLVSHGGTDKEVNLSENQPSTLPATLAEYGIIETLWARHLVASLHRSLRRTVTRTDVLGRSGSLRLFGVSVPSAHLFRRCWTGWITRSGVLSVLLRDFAWKTDRRFSRLWQFSKHSEAPCLPTDARFLFRQLVPVQCIVERSHSVYADARYDHSATGKLNHHLQRTADCQLWRLQHSTMAIGVVFSCPITGRMMFGDDTGKCC
jgi:IS1 family transposase